MAYTSAQWAVVVEGQLAGNEVWANRWSIEELASPSVIGDVSDAFRTFYIAWAQVCDTTWSADRITFRNLGNGAVEQPTWAVVTGAEGDGDPLPNECAVRVSLTAGPGRHGGPFLSGASSELLDSAGNVDATFLGGIPNALASLMDDLYVLDWALRLDSPTDETLRDLTAARIGRVFDVIRRRRNQLSETYINVDVTP